LDVVSSETIGNGVVFVFYFYFSPLRRGLLLELVVVLASPTQKSKGCINLLEWEAVEEALVNLERK